MSVLSLQAAFILSNRCPNRAHFLRYVYALDISRDEAVTSVLSVQQAFVLASRQTETGKIFRKRQKKCSNNLLRD
jgi:hypothetical protein